MQFLIAAVHRPVNMFIRSWDKEVSEALRESEELAKRGGERPRGEGDSRGPDRGEPRHHDWERERRLSERESSEMDRSSADRDRERPPFDSRQRVGLARNQVTNCSGMIFFLNL